MKSFVPILCLMSAFAFLIVFADAPSAMACVPLVDDLTKCDHPRLVHPTIVLAVAVKPPVAVATVSAKRGTSPFDAMEPNDTWQTIAANANVWFRIGEESLNRVHLDVWLDANGKSGINFAVYSPEQSGDLSPATPAKGRGTVNRSDKTHDLTWSGQAPAGGAWFVLVSNSNSTPLPYKLGYNRVVTGSRDCTGPYWEWIGGHVNSEALWPGYCP